MSYQLDQAVATLDVDQLMGEYHFKLLMIQLAKAPLWQDHDRPEQSRHGWNVDLVRYSQSCSLSQSQPPF